jgi:putative hydrolase of the HAD superfamily
MKIRAVSFDVEGTLTTRRFSDVVWEDAIPRLYSKMRGISLEEAKNYVMQEYAKVGEEKADWYSIKYWFSHFGLSDYERLLHHYKHEISYFSDVHQVLESLKKEYRLIVSSNSSREFLNLQLERIRLYFSDVFSATSDFGKTKRDKNFYLNVCKTIGIASAELVHVGDHWICDFVTPRTIDIKAFYLDRSGQQTGEFFVKDLKEFSRRLQKLS